MNTPQLILFFFSGIGILNSLAFAGWLLLTKRGKVIANRLLALLLLALVVRVSKSLFYFLLDGVHIGFINAGLVGKMAIGPLLYLYVRSLTQKNFQWKNAYLWHLAPSIALTVLSPFMSWNLILLAYDITMYQMLAYTIWAYWLVQKFKITTPADKPLKRWLANLCFAIGMVWLAYLSQVLMGGLTVYAIGAAWFALVVYAVLFLALRQQKVFNAVPQEVKYQTSNVSTSALDQYKEPLLILMEEEKVYLDRALNMPALAERLGIRTDVLSRLINEKFGKNFNDFINGYRIAAARKLLENPDWADMKIAAVAIDCGFKSISAFNTAFKKGTGMTPSQYRDQFNGSVKLV